MQAVLGHVPYIAVVARSTTAAFEAVARLVRGSGCQKELPQQCSSYYRCPRALMPPCGTVGGTSHDHRYGHYDEARSVSPPP
jgi:hypothetical protein